MDDWISQFPAGCGRGHVTFSADLSKEWPRLTGMTTIEPGCVRALPSVFPLARRLRIDDKSLTGAGNELFKQSR